MNQNFPNYYPQSQQQIITKLFVGGLSYQTKDETFLQYFARFGFVKKAVIMKSADQSSRGFGFVIFEDPYVANYVVNLKDHIIDGRRVDIRWALSKDQAPPPQQPDNIARITVNKLFVGGLHFQVTKNDLYQYFRQFGEIDSCAVMIHHDSNKSRGFGFVIYKEEESVRRVLSISNHSIMDRKIEVKLAVPKSNIPTPNSTDIITDTKIDSPSTTTNDNNNNSTTTNDNTNNTDNNTKNNTNDNNSNNGTTNSDTVVTILNTITTTAATTTDNNNNTSSQDNSIINSPTLSNKSIHSVKSSENTIPQTNEQSELPPPLPSRDYMVSPSDHSFGSPPFHSYSLSPIPSMNINNNNNNNDTNYHNISINKMRNPIKSLNNLSPPPSTIPSTSISINNNYNNNNYNYNSIRRLSSNQNTRYSSQFESLSPAPTNSGNTISMSHASPLSPPLYQQRHISLPPKLNQEDIHRYTSSSDIYNQSYEYDSIYNNNIQYHTNTIYENDLIARDNYYDSISRNSIPNSRNTIDLSESTRRFSYINSNPLNNSFSELNTPPPESNTISHSVNISPMSDFISASPIPVRTGSIPNSSIENNTNEVIEEHDIYMNNSTETENTNIKTNVIATETSLNKTESLPPPLPPRECCYNPLLSPISQRSQDTSSSSLQFKSMSPPLKIQLSHLSSSSSSSNISASSILVSSLSKNNNIIDNNINNNIIVNSQSSSSTNTTTTSNSNTINNNDSYNNIISSSHLSMSPSLTTSYPLSNSRKTTSLSSSIDLNLSNHLSSSSLYKPRIQSLEDLRKQHPYNYSYMDNRYSFEGYAYDQYPINQSGIDQEPIIKDSLTINDELPYYNYQQENNHDYNDIHYNKSLNNSLYNSLYTRNSSSNYDSDLSNSIGNTVPMRPKYNSAQYESLNYASHPETQSSLYSSFEDSNSLKK
ncbi:hypothetical protein WA158_005244 [Blastocystis sp. Blastoise]